MIRRFFPVVAGLVALCSASARAESHRFNLNVTPGLLLSSHSVGADVGIGADWQFVSGLALDLRIGTLIGTAPFGLGLGFNPAVGLRLRFLDDHQGYSSEKDGTLAGCLSIAPHLGLMVGSWGGGFAVDVEAAYVFSVSRPFSIGAFLRPFVAFGSFGGGDVVMGGATVGVAITFGLGPELGLDHDGDGVGDDRDRCPDTPAGSEVDSRGCTIIPKAMVLDGITFKLNSAEIEPASERTLSRALTALRDNPEARVEIGGHTDDTGTVERNLTLSGERAQSVATWLINHGIDGGRLTTKGYGSSQPKAKNTDEAGRALNRRIEFTRLDQ